MTSESKVLVFGGDTCYPEDVSWEISEYELVAQFKRKQLKPLWNRKRLKNFKLIESCARCLFKTFQVSFINLGFAFEDSEEKDSYIFKRKKFVPWLCQEDAGLELEESCIFKYHTRTFSFNPKTLKEIARNQYEVTAITQAIKCLTKELKIPRFYNYERV